jgi:hypothetical protein
VPGRTAGHSSFLSPVEAGRGMVERPPAELTWARLRPVLLSALLLADAFVVAALALAHPPGWLPPFIAFGVVLVGLALTLAWALRHRDDG